MTEAEDKIWYLLLGVMAGLIFTPVAYTAWWIVGICVLVVWAIIRGWEHD
jgi:hypothetical protein